MIKIIRIPLLLLLLSGCAIVPQSTTPVGHPMPWADRASALAQVQSWTMRGSISIQHARRTDLASLQWTQQNAQYQFALFGPLGFGRVTIAGQPGQITLQQSNKPLMTARTPEALMQRELGWQIPIVYLYDWARGLPAPGIPAQMTFDAYHHLTRLRQEGWEIDYAAYMTVGSVDLPQKMQLTRQDLKIKLAVKNWHIQ